MRYLIAIFITFSILGLLYSCSDNLVNNPGDVVFPDSNVSFQAHVQPVITLNCSYQGCHSNETQAGGIVLTDWTSYFVNTSGLGMVIPGDPDGSRLVQIIETPSMHRPFIIWDLNNNHKQGIRTWIKEGAINN